MANWLDIPREMIIEIARHMEFYEDVLTITMVCHNWREALKEVDIKSWHFSTQPPWLMLVDPADAPSRRYYSMVNGKYIRLDLPPLVLGQSNDLNRRYFSSRGWLISVSQKNCDITLFNPLHKRVIKPPNVPIDLMESVEGEWEDWMHVQYIQKFILSSSPNPNLCDEGGGDNFWLAMIYEARSDVALWRPGQEGWTRLVIDSFKLGYCYDLCFFKGEFYAINAYFQVVALGSIMSNVNREPRIVVDLKEKDVWNSSGLSQSHYIMEWVSEEGVDTLLLLRRYVTMSRRSGYGTREFRLFQLNVESGELKIVTNLGNKSIFVGYNSTFYVEASSSGRSCKPNCIYYSDDNVEWYDIRFSRRYPNGGGTDLRIYSLAQSKVLEPCYHGPSRFDYITPPMWVQVLRH